MTTNQAYKCQTGMTAVMGCSVAIILAILSKVLL
jgi:hypothetical protein